MKKTIIALFALAGISVAADDILFTATNSTTNTVNNSLYNGITLNLSGERINVTPDMLGYDVLYLTSFTTDVRQTQSKDIVLALTSSTGKVLTLSDNTISTTGDQTWTFSNTLVSTTENLYFVFADSASENVAVGNTLAGTDMVMVGGIKLMNYGNQTDYTSCTQLGNNTAKNMTVGRYDYSPYVSLSLKAPEPATATLSLLALAGLAARRRRH